MSLWDKYFAPGDLRRRQQLRALEEEWLKQQKLELQKAAQPPPAPRVDAATRARRQNALLYGGLAFTAFSIWVTRRSLRRKRLQAPPADATSTAPASASKADGAFEAVEALNIATLNVFAVAMAATGIAATYFDIADIEDLRDGIRKGVGYDVYAGDSAADKEMEGWVAGVLAESDGKGGLRESIAKKVVELQEKEKAEKGGDGRR